MFYYCPDCSTYQRWDWSLRHLWNWETQPCPNCRTGKAERVLPDDVSTEDDRQRTQDAVRKKRNRKKKQKSRTAAPALATPPASQSPAATAAFGTSPSQSTATSTTAAIAAPQPPSIASPPAASAPTTATPAATDLDLDGFVEVTNGKAPKLIQIPDNYRSRNIDQTTWEAIRHVYQCQAFEVHNIRQAYPRPGTNPRQYCYTDVKPRKNVRPYLEQLFRDENGARLHANYGTTFHNNGAPLPVSLLRRGGSAYLEYGFGTVSIDQGERWYRLNRGSYEYDDGATQAIGRRLSGAQFGDFDLGDRIVVDLISLRVYYSPDHYTTFYEHEHGTKNWRRVP